MPFPEAHKPDSRVRVVLADDHPLFRDGVRRALERAGGGFEIVAEAGDGPSALEQATRQRVDILLLDTLLPGLSGIEVLRRLKERRATPRTLLVTASMDPVQTLEALDLGARGVVTKRVAADVLVKAIRAVLKGEYWVGHETVADWTEHVRRRREPEVVLTPREQEIVRLVLDGLANREIARRTSLGEETVKTHLRNTYRKLGVTSRMGLALRVAAGKFRLPS
jgi:two-component system nitrate/nitrite response regulator NarL